MEQTAKPAEVPKPKSRTVLYAIVIVILIVVGVAVYYITRPSGPSGPSVAIQDDSACGSGPPPDAACLFNPASINATVNGSPITWNNNGGAPHTVTTCDSTYPSTQGCPTMNTSGLDSFTSGTLAAHSGSFSHTFAKAGTYYYYCTIHPWMHGTVTAKIA